MHPKVLCKVLHLATFHGWRPERLATQAPTASWDTELIVPYIEPYLFGNVSEMDASALAEALKRLLASEALGLSPQVHFSAAAVLAVAEKGPFGIIADEAPTPAGEPSDKDSIGRQAPSPAHS